MIKKHGNCGKICSEETRKKLREASLKNGNKPPSHLGLKRSEETKIKMSEAANKKPKISLETHKKMSASAKIKIFSKEHRRKLGERLKGERSPTYKGGISSANHIIRTSSEMKLWRKACFERDNFTCQKTGQIGGKLIVHHINNFADFPELRFAIDNGITLCRESHIEFHKKYGVKNNTREQIEEYLKYA